MKKVQDYLSAYYEEIYHKENRNIEKMIRCLEAESTISSEKKKNNHPLVECNMFENCTQNDEDKEEYSWNYYEEGHFNREESSRSKNPIDFEFHS